MDVWNLFLYVVASLLALKSLASLMSHHKKSRRPATGNRVYAGTRPQREEIPGSDIRPAFRAVSRGPERFSSLKLICSVSALIFVGTSRLSGLAFLSIE